MSNHLYCVFGKKNFIKLIPKKKETGTRKYTPKDIENIQLIYHLVKERGMTLEGARKQLKQKSGAVAQKEILTKLEKIKFELKEILDHI